MMDVLSLSLHRNATRGYIYADLLDQLSEAERIQVRNRLEDMNIPHEHHHDLAAVEQRIDSLEASDRVKDDARSIYRILAEAEAQVHGCTLEQTHFHEVGKGEAIENVIGICLAIEALDPLLIQSSVVQTGRGKVECAHGILDIPAPATAAILSKGIPTCKDKLDGELCTPTSAAIIYHFVDEFISQPPHMSD